MIRYLIRRIGLIFITLFLISFAIFMIVEVLPGDVAKMMLKQSATEETLHRLREQLGLYRPWYERYFAWVFGILQGDWGRSYVMPLPASLLLTHSTRGVFPPRIRVELAISLSPSAFPSPSSPLSLESLWRSSRESGPGFALTGLGIA